MNALCCVALLLAPNVPAQPAAAAGGTNPYQMSQNGYWGYTGDPYMTGLAQVIDASGRLMLATQQARLMQEDVKSAQIDNRRKRLEQWLWERENLPKPEDERRLMLQESLRRSRHNPPLTEIWSARALNDLLLDLAAVDDLQDQTPLSVDMLEKLNLTTGKGDANVGFLKSDLRWRPQLLRAPGFSADADRLVALVRKSAEQITDKFPDYEVMKEMLQLHRRLRERLNHQARTTADGEFSPSMYIDAKTYLDQVHDVIKVFQRPDAAKYFETRYTAKAKTIGELVQYMKAHGLRFAPATNGAEDAYTALHHALAAVSRRAGANVEKK